MVILISIFEIIFSIVSGTQVLASPYSVPDPNVKRVEKAKTQLCHSTDEFVKMLKILRETKEFGYREDASRLIADQVSIGCDGSAERFKQILILLKSVGLSDRKSLAMALEFSQVTPDVQKNFLEIFSKAFLSEFFDYEFPKAMELALELSRDYRGDPKKAREDFLYLVKFCKDTKGLDLPLGVCADYSVAVARLSQFHEQGVAKPFQNVLQELRNQRDLSLNLKLALEVAYKILKHGPLAFDNFMSAFKFATEDLKYSKDKSIEFGLTLASRSHIGIIAPILQFPPEIQKYSDDNETVEKEK